MDEKSGIAFALTATGGFSYETDLGQKIDCVGGENHSLDFAATLCVCVCTTCVCVRSCKLCARVNMHARVLLVKMDGCGNLCVCVCSYK